MGTYNFFTNASVISLPTLLLLCRAADTITPTQSLTDGMTLVSSGRMSLASSPWQLQNRSPICECLDGFVPRSQNEWEVLNWSNGCSRKTPLDCRRGEGFIKFLDVKLPDLLDFWLNKSISLHECKEMCLKNCSCIAYANSDIRDGGSGCLMWFGDLVDVRELRVQLTKQDVYIQLSASAMSACIFCL
ncbi:hypothetical protein FEM48_Zijuj01G0211600 [Ziziphus jujuba var. spinosa]|uniref:Apple domain-containing protein n=1 Tax=Ziziphus jujuba var. spinosa TaxID=714518 RepID=A0A978W3K5_ZIZJJ|nr:hypothetical protein FEM48_Zijuj01G0211600 [Ziziphus jujuba var. spinosa]